MRILIVEDDPVSLTFLESALLAQGHVLTVAEDGEKAWTSILTGDFQVIISDWNLPGISGIDLCRRIRERHYHGYIYFFIITSYQGSQRLAEAMDAGIDDFLSKPLDISALTIRLRVANRILDFHRQLGALQELIPICMYCKRIRKDQVYWENVETFFSAQTGADFTHSLCPDCYTEKIKPELDSLKRDAPGTP